jgi:glycogen(starch) synthase
MRLAYCVRAIFPQHGYGGLERSASGLLRHLLLRGLDVALFTRPLPQGQPLSAPGHLSVRSVQYGRLPLPPNGIPARLTNYKIFVDSVGRKVRLAALRGAVQGVYAHGLCATGVRHAAEWGVPLVANPHGMEEFKITDPLKRLAYTPFRAWLRAGYRAADRVVATDHGMVDEVVSLLGVEREKVVVLPNGVDIDELKQLVSPAVQRELTERWSIPSARSNDITGISVGRMEANKGFEHLLRALALVKWEPGAHWRWFFVGEGSLLRHLQEVAHTLGLGEHVVFTGKLDETELHSLYASCNLFVHPTLYEGSSLVTLEAMAHALPVVASAVGGIPDKVEDGNTGFLVQPGDEQALALKIAWMAVHPHERAEMGHRGADRAAEWFSWQTVAAQTEELFYMLRDEKAGCAE